MNSIEISLFIRQSYIVLKSRLTSVLTNQFCRSIRFFPISIRRLAASTFYRHFDSNLDHHLSFRFYTRLNTLCHYVITHKISVTHLLYIYLDTLITGSISNYFNKTIDLKLKKTKKIDTINLNQIRFDADRQRERVRYLKL